MKKFLTTLALIGFVLVAFAQPAQQNIGANGILYSEITIVADKDLEFGIMTRGQDNVIEVPDMGAGVFIMSIDEVGEIILTFELPTHLTNGDGGQVPLTFTETSAGYGFSNQTGQQATLFNPNTPTPIYFHNSSQDWNIYIGGIATPATDAPMGEYSAEITLTADYN